jgi:p-hydroxybenzoate 3-monooxygenase
LADYGTTLNDASDTSSISWWMKTMLHRFPDERPFDRRLQAGELDYLRESEAAQKALAENYVGLPY